MHEPIDMQLEEPRTSDTKGKASVLKATTLTSFFSKISRDELRERDRQESLRERDKEEELADKERRRLEQKQMEMRERARERKRKSRKRLREARQAADGDADEKPSKVRAHAVMRQPSLTSCLIGAETARTRRRRSIRFSICFRFTSSSEVQGRRPG